MSDAQRRDAFLALAIVIGLTGVKVMLAAQLELTSPEAYYWMYAQHPALGYYDHPAMIGWLVWLSTALFGESPLGVRMMSVLGGGVALWFTFLTGRLLYGARAGLWATILVGLAPLTMTYGARATPDAPLLLFWTTALWTLTHALREDGARWWYATGFLTGLALLSKYTAVFFPAGVLLFLALSRDHRRWLRRPEPYIATAIVFLVFTPTLVWNAIHNWASLRYQGIQRIQEQGRTSWKDLVNFPLSQLLLLTPVLCLWSWGAGLLVARRWRQSPWQSQLMSAMGLPMILFFTATIVVHSVRGHWATPAYVSLLILVGGRLDVGRTWLRRATTVSVAVVAIALLVAPMVVALTPRMLRTGWEQLATEVRALSPDFVITRDYHAAGHLGYFLRPMEACDFTALGKPKKGFAYWYDAARWRGKTAVIVLDAATGPNEMDLVKTYFQRLDEPLRIKVGRLLTANKSEFLLIRAQGYCPP